MKKQFLLFVSMFLSMRVLGAPAVVHVPASGGDMTRALQAAIEKVRSFKGKPVVIALQNADYHLSREASSKVLYYVSNTTSEQENPDATKHIGLWLKGLHNVTIDGCGARLVTHGEMTSFVIDSCRNIVFRNFTVTAADPTVPEMTVVDAGDRHLTVRTHPLTHYSISPEGKLSLTGEGWSFSRGIAQAYDAGRDVTWRCWSPLDGLRKAIELEPGLLRLNYASKPQGYAGLVYQLRDAIRDEVCGLIQFSRRVTLENLHLAFLGNFGLVSQMSEDITYRRLTFEPEAGSSRTCAGFADFVQMSGCKGRILIENSRFSGAHDDPINIHGTHLSVRQWIAPDCAVVRYMHPQTFGFQSFVSGDEVELVDAHSLLPKGAFRVRKAVMRNPREIVLTFSKPVPEALRALPELVVENTTYTPEVIVRGNYFSRIPSRGLLVTTRRPVLIEDNTFFRMQMSGILIADDARSWYESGPVSDVTIRGNRFIECGSPVVYVAPENDRVEGAVHHNITIAGNRFKLNPGSVAVWAKSVDGLRVTDNWFDTPEPADTSRLVQTNACSRVTVQNNRMK